MESIYIIAIVAKKKKKRIKKETAREHLNFVPYYVP